MIYGQLRPFAAQSVLGLNRRFVRPAARTSHKSRMSPFYTRREILLSVAIALGTALPYMGVLGNGFINFDDNLYVYNNRFVLMGLSRASVTWAFTSTEISNWHPLTWLSLELDYHLFGLNAKGFHATNLVLHVADTVLVFWLLRNLSGAVYRSACAAAIFALHPLHVESVAWIAERKDMLSTLFLLLSILFWQSYARSARGSPGNYGLALAFFILSLMAKAMGLTLPLLLLLLDVWPLGRWQRATAESGQDASRPLDPEHDTVPAGADGDRFDESSSSGTMATLVVEKLPFFLVSATFAAIAVLTQGKGGAMQFGRSLPLVRRLTMVPLNYVTYLGRTFWPVDLAVLYPHPGADLPLWKPAGALVVILLISAVVGRLRKSFPYLLVGWLWFLVTLLPVIGLVQIGRQATADRYMYFPMIGLLVMACWGGWDVAATYRRLTMPLIAAAVIVLIACAEMTARQVTVWHDDVTLWKHALSVTRPTVPACVNYAMSLSARAEAATSQTDRQSMRDEGERWLRQAQKIDPWDFSAHYNLGTHLFRQGRYAEAVAAFRAALDVRPNDPSALDALGMAEEEQGHLGAALESYERAAEADPRSVAIHQRLQRVRQKRDEAKANRDGN
jgi:protein O-mannosyl-transferase